jgi:general L-amino acid transport system ATP-binding protein
MAKIALSQVEAPGGDGGTDAVVAIDVRDVSKWYGQVQVLNGVSLKVQARETVVVVGPSGSGKSTLVRCIGGLEEYQAGRILVHGQESAWSAQGSGRHVIGMVFQQYNLFPHLTVLENLMLAPLAVRKMLKSEAEDLAGHYLARVHITEHAQKYPAQLSGGQQQRAAIARALCMQPNVMLFDEPTAALDPEMVQEVLEVMSELAGEGMTMVCVTHELRFARGAADTIVFMDDGCIVEKATPDQFFDHTKTARVREFLSKMTSTP